MGTNTVNATNGLEALIGDTVEWTSPCGHWRGQVVNLIAEAVPYPTAYVAVVGYSNTMPVSRKDLTVLSRHVVNQFADEPVNPTVDTISGQLMTVSDAKDAAVRAQDFETAAELRDQEERLRRALDRALMMEGEFPAAVIEDGILIPRRALYDILGSPMAAVAAAGIGNGGLMLAVNGRGFDMLVAVIEEAVVSYRRSENPEDGPRLTAVDSLLTDLLLTMDHEELKPSWAVHEAAAPGTFTTPRGHSEN